jgi:hypothetical protein
MAEVRQRLFSIAETMKILNRSRTSVWRDIKAGRLATVHIGGSVRVTGDSIDRLCAVGAPLAIKRKPPRRLLRARE